MTHPQKIQFGSHQRKLNCILEERLETVLLNHKREIVVAIQAIMSRLIISSEIKKGWKIMFQICLKWFVFWIGLVFLPIDLLIR